MMVSSMPLYLLLAVVIAAAIQDVARLRISNRFPLIVIALYIANGAITGNWHLFDSTVLFLIVLAAGAVLFHYGILGGGDVKLLCALALWCSFGTVGWLLLSIAMFGGLVALLFMFARRLLPSALTKRLGWSSLIRRGPIPYGVAIASGVILCFTLISPSITG